MNEKVYILGDILQETKKRFPYVTFDKFVLLYYGWRQQGIRHGRNAPFYSVAWKRGWLAPKDADDFRKYIGLR